MKKKLSFFPVGVLWNTPAFLFLIALFLCGAIAGGFTGLMSGTQSSVQRLADYFIVGTGAETSLLRQTLGALGGTALWLVIALLAGCLTPHSLFLAALVAARGFTLSLTVAASITQLGLPGLWLSLGTTGLASLVTVPCLLLVATAAFQAAGDAPPGQRGGYLYALARYRGALVICSLLSLLVAVLRACVFSPLLRLVA